MDRKRVGIVVFDDIEVLDFCGPFEVFAATRINEARRWEEASPFEVVLVAQKPGPCMASGGMAVLPHHTLQDCPRLDVLVVPGGRGTRREVENTVLLDWLRERAGEVARLTSVCTGSMLLGFAGLLDGRKATIHRHSVDWMRGSFPSVQVEEGKRFVQDGHIYTSAGISTGIDMALGVVASYFGQDVARSTARHMEYPYPDPEP